MRSMRASTMVAAVMVVVGAVLLTACDPVVAIQVTTTIDGSDADPGDGVCEATAGLGDCTLRAALDEAGTALAATVEVPAGTYALTVADADGSTDLDVTGTVELNWESSAAVLVLAGGDLRQVAIDVQPGARFTASGLQLTDGRLQVAGTALLDRVILGVSVEGLLGSTGPRLVVLPSGVVALGNSSISGSAGGVQSAGTTSLVYTTVWTNGGPSVATTGSGATTLQAVKFVPMGVFKGVWAFPDQPLCVGNLPQSNGGNWGPNATCQLTGEADVQTATTIGTGTGRQYVPTWRDMIPVGVAGCGTASTVDALGVPRPTDDNGDGVAACDAGDREGG